MLEFLGIGAIKCLRLLGLGFLICRTLVCTDQLVESLECSSDSQHCVTWQERNNQHCLVIWAQVGFWSQHALHCMGHMSTENHGRYCVGVNNGCCCKSAWQRWYHGQGQAGTSATMGSSGMFTLKTIVWQQSFIMSRLGVLNSRSLHSPPQSERTPLGHSDSPRTVLGLCSDFFG